MNRDSSPPTTDEIAAWSTVIVGTAMRYAGPVPRSAMVSAIAAVETPLRRLWLVLPPESVRDALGDAAGLAHRAGLAAAPDGVDDPGGLVAAVLALADQPAAAGQPSPLRAWASSQAFDRDEDEVTFRLLVVLLALAYAGATPQ